MQDDSPTRRSYGSGSLYQKNGNWYGRWYVGEKRVNRKLGRVRQTGTSDGLTRTQAEKELRRRQEREHIARNTAVRVTFAQAAQRQVDRMVAKGLKKSSIENVDTAISVHLLPFFGQRPLEKITREDVERFVGVLVRTGLKPKSIHNYFSPLNSIFELGVQRGWVVSNPCKGVELPRVDVDPQTRYLDRPKLEAVLVATPDDLLGQTERVLYLAAATTGAREGELFALQWRDVDWSADVIRIERNFTHGQYGTPKSGKPRYVPLGRRLAQALEWHSQQSAFQGEDDLVFPHPATGNPLDASKILKRLKRACKRAGVEQVRFHDLRHTFGTHMAKVTSLRDIQEWMGHEDAKTTLRYAAFMSGADDAALVDEAFGEGTVSGTNLSEPKRTQETPDALG